MSDDARYLVLNAYLRNSGYHEAAWRVNDDDPAVVLDPAHYVRLARAAERGVLDLIFLPDSPGQAEYRSRWLPGGWLDPVDLLCAVAGSTELVGLAATVSTTYSQPWDVARRLATLDFVSHGRAGWNIVTTVEPAAAANFGGAPHPPRDKRYERADEYVRVALALWDAWEQGAAVLDKASGDWADLDRVHAPHHHGEHFSVAGHLTIPRSPQGRPLLLQAGSSPAGVALAARYADAVFTPQTTVSSAAQARSELRTQAAQFGRDPDVIKVLPALSYVLGSTEREAVEKRQRLEAAASSEFRWRNFANLAGLDVASIEPDDPFPAALLDAAPRTSFGAAIYAMAGEGGATFREIAQRLSAMPGGLDFTGTPEQLADLITEWFTAGAVDGFTLMPHALPRELDLFVEHVVPLLQQRGIARHEYAGTTLREHLGLPSSDVVTASRAVGPARR